jgi:26S proteasome regulatory subunit N3
MKFHCLFLPMKSFEEIIKTVKFIQFDDRLIQDYRESFESIISNISPEQALETIQQMPESVFTLAPFYVGALCKLHRFEEIKSFLQRIDLSGSDRHLDYFNGLLLKYYYLSLKHCGESIVSLYKLKITNKEYNNEYSVAVITNSILDYQINNNIYQTIPEQIKDPEQKCLYSFYNGIIHLVKGEYKLSLSCFDEADTLNKARSLEMKIKKYTIICKLLQSDYSIFYPFSSKLTPYFSLIGAVKRAEISNLYSILDQYKEEFAGMNLYFIIRRLVKNVLHEGLRRISVCYSRISLEDINSILKVNVDYLIHSMIKDKVIKGHVSDGIFYSENGKNEKLRIGHKITECINLRNSMRSLMKFPEIIPLTYENVFETELNKDQ